MSFIGSSINDSPVIYGQAGADLTNAAFKAAVFDNNGNIVVASSAGVNVAGIFIAETGESVDTGDNVTIQIKDCGLMLAGAAIAAGAEIAVNSSGKAVTATDGDFIFGTALEAATAADDVIRVQITKSGYKPTT